MPSTTTTQFGVTGRTIIDASLRRMRVLPEGGTANATQMSDGLFLLNTVLKSIATTGVRLWCYYQVLVPLVVGQLEYTIGPSGANVTANRPMRIEEYGNYWRQVIGGTNYDIPLSLISRSDYMQYGIKGSQGAPNSIYYSATIDTGAAGGATDATGYGRLLVYLTASATITGTLYLNAYRYIFDMSADTNSVDIPAEGYLALDYLLCSHWGDQFSVPEDRLKRYADMAKGLFAQFLDSNVEQAPTKFQPDVQSAGYSTDQRQW